MTQVFVDMDGVLADFDTGYERAFGTRPSRNDDSVDWKAVREADDFFLRLPPMPDMNELWDFVKWLTPQPIVLTGIPSSVPEAPMNKAKWVAAHLGNHVQVRCCLSKSKCLHAKPGDILIDDWEKYRDLWIASGGRWITHTSANNSIDKLLEMGIGL